MKQQEIEQLILLEQSGELSLRQAHKLRRLLERDPDARALKEEILRVTAAAKDAPLKEEVSDFSLHRIIEEARRTARSAPAESSRFELPALRYAFAAAAVAAVCLIAWSLFPQSRQLAEAPPPAPQTTDIAWDDELDEAFDTVFAMIEEDWGNLESNGNGADEDLDEMARELLELEGISI